MRYEDDARHMVPLASMLSWANEDIDTVSLEFWIVGANHRRSLSEKTLQGTSRKLHLCRIANITHPDIAGARARQAGKGAAVELTFSAAGRQKMARMAKEHAEEMLGMLVEGQLLAVSEMRDIGSRGKALLASDHLTLEEATSIADALLGR